jgi:hypothetical protein
VDVPANPNPPTPIATVLNIKRLEGGEIKEEKRVAGGSGGVKVFVDFFFLDFWKSVEQQQRS